MSAGAAAGRGAADAQAAAAAAKGMSPEEATAVAESYAQYSLRQIAERKLRQLTGVKQPDVAPFADSQIVEGVAAKALYYCLPFNKSQPLTSLLFATWRDGRSCQTLLEACADGGFGPTVLLVRSGAFVFGGYASDAWLHGGFGEDGREVTPEQRGRFGSPKCYLFSITTDRKIPFHGRTQDAKTQTRPEYDQFGNPYPMQLDCLQAGEDSVQFGISDLVLSGDFSQCTSKLEGSYGFGLKPNSPEAHCFLGGSHVFHADEVELYLTA
jgi:hypothetical protein